MQDPRRSQMALFRLAVLGDLIHGKLGRGALARSLEKKSQELWRWPDGPMRRIAAKTIESWYYQYRKHGFDGLMPQERRDKGACKAIPAELQTLIVEMKREDPGRSIPLIVRELEQNGLVRKRTLRPTTMARLLKKEGLSGPKLELKTPARYRFQAATCGELWQGDACHGPKYFDPDSGRELRVKIFGLIDDRSRLVPYLRAGFHETQEDFLRVLRAAVLRRGRPLRILLDNHGSFVGEDVRLACAKLDIRLVHARPYDGPAKGKIERLWRTLRAHVLDRLDADKVVTLDDLNLRLMTWVDGDYNQRPHAGLSGRTPLSVFEEGAGEIRWVEDPRSIESAFLSQVSRQVRNDSTCTLRGKVYEVPPHLRGGPVEICFHLFDRETVWILDGTTQVFLREVDPVANSTRARLRPSKPLPSARKKPKKTGLNAVEDRLQRLLRPRKRRDDDHERETCDA